MAPHCSTCCCQSTQVPLDTPELPDAVKSHILSNEPPSPSDFPMLRDYRLSIDPYITRLDTEIAALSTMQEALQKTLDFQKATLNDLREERRALKERQQHISGALSSLRRLPLEILQEIFLCTLARPGKPDYPWVDVCDPEDSTSTVRRVCRKWRMAAQYPHMWTCLRIENKGLRNLSVVRGVVDRSGALPLRIHFFWDESGHDIFFGRLVLDELVRHSERWQHASFNGMAHLFTRSMSALRGRLPKLEELEFSHWGFLSGDHIENAHPFEIAPSLTKANVYRAVIKLDYSQLKSFTSVAHRSAALRVIVSSPNLTYLADHSSTASPNDGSSRNKTRYLHSRLNMLCLEQCAELNLFTLPNLQHLEAGSTYASALYPSLPIISSFLHISHCPLLSLTIHNCQLSIGSMPEILQVLPGLQRLSIFFKGFPIESSAVTSSDEALTVLLHRLAERASKELSRPRLVPNLQSFTFKSCFEDPWRFMDASIVDMIHVRSGLESVSFTIHPQSQLPNLSDDDVACYQEQWIQHFSREAGDGGAGL